MSGRLYDRVSGLVCPSYGDAVVAGRYLLNREGEPGFFLNGFKCDGGEYLVPDANGQWELLVSNGARRHRGTGAQASELDELERGSIRALGQGLEALYASGAQGADWQQVSPLVPGMSQKAELQNLERMIMEELGHLEEVCHRPRAHLLVDIERTTISRARRIPHQAASYLASHSEDWERPTLHAILPKRILAVVRDDEWNIYENRVAVRLVDNLLAYCSRRVHELQRLARVFEEASNYSKEAAVGSIWRQKRVFKLWGGAIDANEGLARVAKTLKVVDGLRLRLAGLKDTRLYRVVPRGARVSSTLVSTNILSNDDHYRHVAKLWKEWARLEQRRRPTPRGLHRERQEVCHGFARYCFLLVVRALEQMRYPLMPSSALGGPNASIAFGQPYDGHELVRNDDDTVSIRCDGQCALRIVPIALPLDGLREAELEALLDDLSQGANRQALCVCLFPPASSSASREGLSEKLRNRLCALPHDFATRDRTTLGVMSVSPWDLGSVEKVGRIVRWAIERARFGEYPFKVNALPSAVRGAAASEWLRQTVGGDYEVFVPPTDAQVRKLNLKALRRGAEEKHQRLEREHGAVSLELEKVAKRGGATASLNASKKRLAADVKEAYRQVESLRECDARIEASARRANALLICPVCGTTLDARNFIQGGGRRFECSCPNCSAVYGTRSCGACGDSFPTLLPKCGTPDAGAQWGWVDRMLGCDVLATPIATGDGFAFVCPACGEAS